MSPFSKYSRQIDSLRRSRRGVRPFRKPIQLSEILGKTEDSNFWAYKIGENTGALTPRSLPKDGDFVLVETGSCPSNMLNNPVYIRDISETYDAWIPTHKFYVGQIVSFWIKDLQYDFQIQFSDHSDEKICKFVLVNKTKTERQPGVAYRTTKSKMNPK